MTLNQSDAVWDLKVKTYQEGEELDAGDVSIADIGQEPQESWRPPPVREAHPKGGPHQCTLLL